MKVLASGLLDAAGWSQRLDISGCARTGSLRVGEALHPGPRQRVGSRNFSLEAAPVQSFASISLGEKQWLIFLTWAATFLGGDPLGLFLQLPLFLAHAVRKFGDIEFQRGGSLMYYRRLVLGAQRKVPNLKPFVSICWDLASRWEKAEPTRHRPPVPETLVEACVALSWCFGWRRWAAVTLLAFFGIARAGEVLRCCRADLLPPEDAMYETAAAFLVFRISKTMYRQNARVQHVKIENRYVIKLLATVYRGVEPSEKLYDGSAHVFRRRWDFLLKLLQVPVEINVTPGGLRGGGAVSFYRKGGGIADLTWAMRLKQMATLENYLRGVAALSLLTDLPSASRRSIRCASSFYPRLLS